MQIDLLGKDGRNCMARKVTTDDIKQFNELYYKYKSYAEVARITGWSSSTVSKYVDKNYLNPFVNSNYEVKDIFAPVSIYKTNMCKEVVGTYHNFDSSLSSLPLSNLQSRLRQ